MQQTCILRCTVLESVDRVLRVLEVFGPSKPTLSLSEIAIQSGLPKSSVHRLLATLIARGFLERDLATLRYRVGIRLFELGSTVLHERGLQSSGMAVAEQLAAATRETCHLAVLSGVEAVYVSKFDGASSIIMSSKVGSRAPSYCTAIGKVLIAWGGDELVEQVVASGLRPHTRKTITEPSELARELERVRLRGYALDIEELEDGLRCVAAPVRDFTGAVVAGIGIAGPAARFSEELLPNLARRVLDAAVSLSRSLGYVNREAIPASP